MHLPARVPLRGSHSPRPKEQLPVGDIAGFAVAEQALEPSELHSPCVLPGAFALMAFLPVTEITCQAEANNEPQVRFSLVGCPGCLSQSLGVTQL